MIETSFLGASNIRRRLPTSKQLLSPPKGKSFEQRAFACLFEQSHRLEIESIWQCNAARMDGYIITNGGEVILLEMKESLRWGSTQSATFQFLAGKHLLGLTAKRGIIVFERWSDEWGKIEPHGAWGQLALHAAEVSEHISIGALRICTLGQVSFAKSAHLVPHAEA